MGPERSENLRATSSLYSFVIHKSIFPFDAQTMPFALILLPRSILSDFRSVAEPHMVIVT